MKTVEEFEALWPGGVNAVPAIPPAPRPADLNGKRIGFLWDYVFRGDEIFPVLERALAETYDDVEFVGYDAFGSTFAGDEHETLAALPQRLKELEIDAVVSGVGG
ncbi:MAG: hypothetical protein F4204_01940 [Rhodospirillaceae bacterium]|nr:hypothetical protein [Rhodospirillaceae bacterium]MYG51132.1 hypothetical protein [Rhodospirillaceae bacterium]